MKFCSRATVPANNRIRDYSARRTLLQPPGGTEDVQHGLPATHESPHVVAAKPYPMIALGVMIASMSEEKADNTGSADGSREKLGDSPRRNRPSTASNTDESPSSEAVAEMVAGCRRQHRDAQRRLYESFHRRIYWLMVRMVGVDAAADLTQQVFLQVFRAIDKYSGRGPFDRWLHRVAMNEAFQHLRRERRRRHPPLTYEPRDPSVGGEQRAEQSELMEHALARLDPELRAICLLREVEELSYREIAETLEIPEGTVGSRLNRARRELKQHLIDLGWQP